jgi:MFS family permease
LISVLVGGVLAFLWVTVAGHLSDRIGRKRMYTIGAVFVGIFGFVFFALLDTKVPALMFLAIALSGLPIMTMYGPEAALIAESFTPRLRYSGTSLGYQLASPAVRRRLSLLRSSRDFIRASRSPSISPSAR